MNTQKTLANIISSSKFTILLGKNGAGKSTRMRLLASSSDFHATYISPERGGTLKYDPNVDNNISVNNRWLTDTRLRNRFEQFREQSAAQFRMLEMLILREIEKDRRQDHSYTFDSILELINNLLPEIKLTRSDKGFSIQAKNGTPIDESLISSGESELIALAIEVLVFSRSSDRNKVLLLDEPDVHLHPDLQHKFITFVENVANEKDFKVVLSTHSTAIVSSFSRNSKLTIVPITNKDQNQFYEFTRSDVCDQILPIFGAHPLSSVFNKTPVVLVEGDDDKRVLEQAMRSSNGRLKFAPCVVGTVSALKEWEKWLNTFLPVLYDNPIGFSLRDLDDSSQAEIDDIGVVKRIRLNCYSIENLLLTIECLNAHGLTESDFLQKLTSWLDKFNNHKFSAEAKYLVDNFDSRRTFKIKNLRNIIVAIMETNKPWEVIVGQSIANKLTASSNTQEHSLNNYLGHQAISDMFS